MKKILLLTFLLLQIKVVYCQHLISCQLIQSYSYIQVDSIFHANGIVLTPVRYPVDIYKVIYSTISYDSSATYASGALIVPSGHPCRMPVVSYQHGTVLKREDVPSRNTGEIIIGIGMATDGYVCCMADYLGLGDSPIPLHPYIHAASEASACLDMLRASKESCDSLGIELNDQLFLTGYSQGGHSTAALQRLIESRFNDEFHITASCPMSGPYDVSGIQSEVITNDSVFSQPAFLPFVMFSYDEVYHVIYNDHQIFNAPYDTTLRPLFNGNYSTGDVNNIMPAQPNLILNPAMLDSFRTDPNHYFRVALRDNDVYDWTPQAPTRICYCNGDEQVDYRNAIVAHNKWIANGALNTDIIDIDYGTTSYTHVECARYALIYGKWWFDTLRTHLLDVELAVTASSTTSATGSITATVTNGTPPFEYHWSNGDSTATISNLPAGYYTVTITDDQDCAFTDSALVGLVGVDEIETMAQQIKVVPNPVHDYGAITFGTLKYKSLETIATDATGKQVDIRSTRIGNAMLFDVRKLPSGIYFFQIKMDDKNSILKKIVVI
ncbi:MAG: T9SS type A sorting domain-containing protein [Bacteroidetes bacterium]|nr:T9SS type A sorting domain-containing protein [Bacteroidota bacterium]